MIPRQSSRKRREKVYGFHIEPTVQSRLLLSADQGMETVDEIPSLNQCGKPLLHKE